MPRPEIECYVAESHERKYKNNAQFYRDKALEAGAAGDMRDEKFLTRAAELCDIIAEASRQLSAALNGNLSDAHA